APPHRSAVFPYTTLFRSNGDWWYQVYLVDVTVDTWADYGGFFNVYVDWRENTGNHNPWAFAYGIGSIQVGNENEPFPAHCPVPRSEEHTSELQSRENLVC